ncbi:MAG: glutamyl-tRNA reductase [Gammaproteobacteria bacterium]|nr:glutamyl-tRNA reductase [Gammaproteobacteria bacterium]
MPFFALGINHNTAPVEIRERLAFDAAATPGALDDLIIASPAAEAVILSTCNRTEIYCELSEYRDGTGVIDWLCARQVADDPTVRERLYSHYDNDVVRHLLQVACGLDSMVLGEPQILGQLKQAYDVAKSARTVGPSLNRLFQYSFSVAKQVRTDTSIGENAVSVAFAAVSLARQIFGKFTDQTALLIGAGETIELTAHYLHEKELGRLVVANRSLDRAHDLAARFNGYAIPLTELHAHLGEADIVISSTGSPEPILLRETVTNALEGRRHKPVFMLDIAVPRDIDSAIGELEDIYLYTIDDLREVIKENLRSREQAAGKANEIIDARASQFETSLRVLDAVPAIQQFRGTAENERDRTLQQAKAMLKAGKSMDDVLEFLANTLTNRLMHNPTTELRNAAGRGDAELIAAFRRLFNLDEENP